MQQAQIYLASRSPRRRELLEQIGVHPTVVQVNVDETPRLGESPESYVLRLAQEKAQAGKDVIKQRPLLPLLAADTAVVVERQILGKPRDRADALEMLQLLSGRSHQVLTGIALYADTCESRLSTSTVTFRTIAPDEAKAYWATTEPVDKAGGYAIQGVAALFISQLEGSFSGVMGLPLFETGELLRHGGIRLLDRSNQ